MSYYFIDRYFDNAKRFFSYDYKDYSFRIDLQYGELYFTRKLISFSGKHLPIDLSLKYSQIRANTYDNLNTYTGFPRGFKTNYHVFLEYDFDFSGYKYEDKDGFLHRFILAINSSTLYYDELGSGLMLITTNSGYKVFDDEGNYQLFDQYGRLITIHKKITSSHYAEQNITYTDNSSLKILAITDNYDRTISFSYTSSYVQISYNSNTIITIYQNNNLLTKISKDIGGNNLVEDTFGESFCELLDNVSLATGETININYCGDDVECFITNIKQDVFSFSYDVGFRRWAEVTNARGVKTHYDFDEKNFFSQTSENSDDLGYIKLNSDIASCIVKEAITNNEITVFTFNGSAITSSIDTSSNSTGYSNFTTNNNLQPKKMYLLVAEINGNLAQDSFEIQLLDYDNHLLAELIFKGNTKQLAFPVGICSSTQKSFKLKYLNKCPNSVEILNAKLVPLIGDFEMLCTNIDFGGPIFFYGDEPHYILKDALVLMIEANSVAQYGYIIKKSDLLANERNVYKNNMNHFWANDKQILISGAQNFLTIINTNQYIGYSLALGGLVYLTYNGSAYQPQSLISLFRIKGNDNNTFSVTKISHNSPSFHTGYTSMYYEEIETIYSCGNTGYITYYDYDENHSLMELNQDDGYKEVYSYDNNGNLISKTISHTSISKQIKSEYEYDANDNLQLEKKLIGSSIKEVNYGYDSFGNIAQIDYPNDYSQSFDYDNVSGERNLSVSFDDNDSITIEQDNNYIDSDCQSVSNGNNTYLFTYDAGRLTGVSYNDQQIVSLTHYTPIHSGYPLNTRYVIQYMNGYYATCEKDAFDRVISNEGLSYTYDEFSNVTNIYDDTSGGIDPNTSYTYDYYDDLQSINVESNGLSLSLTRDIYRRIVSKAYCLNNSGLYTLSYTYYTKPGLENSIKKSELSYNSMSITVTDNTDDLSRLANQAISFNNLSFAKLIEYYNGDFNNSLTNNMVKSVKYFNVSSNPSVDNYSYDARGNVNHVTRTIVNSLLGQIDYIYDTFSRLVRENNTYLGRTYVYNYDVEGNIISKHEYVFTNNQVLYSPPIQSWFYSYNGSYKNRLISFKGQSIEYDAIGNPTLYKGKTMSWTRGTLLSQVIDGGNTINLTYDGFKQRIVKTVNNIITNYSYIDKQLLRETKGNQTITYLYSHSGVIGFVLSGYSSSLNGIYFYEKNIMQDVESIRNSNNQSVAIYQYDAWGNHKVLNPNGTENTSSTFIGNINPIRYRSYYYDTDLKMYWLTTRYYDPEVGRFISPDHYSYLDYRKLHGLNLYAYSKNNPVMYYDPSGHFSLFTIFTAIVTTVIAVAGLVLTVYGAGLGLNAIKRHGSNKESELPESEKDNYPEDPYTEDGVVIHYNIDKSKGNQDKYILQVYESWKYTEKEIDAFLKWLKYDKGYSNLDIGRVKNEWLWHNAMYGYGIATDSTKRVDIYLNAADPIWGWFFDFFRIW